ncbi:hypothetical protein [Pseudomonas huanghezhanensis]|uniref:hypothetical protein n=1 Tax=Pseudomonas huanghezhanensis TaxID=3002903 RepID=UPI00228645C2|nr:hypothetical protein [Pseudomonas sp. BSw22131]
MGVHLGQDGYLTALAHWIQVVHTGARALSLSEQKARQAAKVAASQLSKAAWGTLLMLLISAAVSFGVGRYAITSRPARLVAEV